VEKSPHKGKKRNSMGMAKWMGGGRGEKGDEKGEVLWWAKQEEGGEL